MFSARAGKSSCWYKPESVIVSLILVAEIVHLHFLGNPSIAQRRKAMPAHTMLDMTSIFFDTIPREKTRHCLPSVEKQTNPKPKLCLCFLLSPPCSVHKPVINILGK